MTEDRTHSRRMWFCTDSDVTRGAWVGLWIAYLCSHSNGGRHSWALGNSPGKSGFPRIEEFLPEVSKHVMSQMHDGSRQLSKANHSKVPLWQRAVSHRPCRSVTLVAAVVYPGAHRPSNTIHFSLLASLLTWLTSAGPQGHAESGEQCDQQP